MTRKAAPPLGAERPPQLRQDEQTPFRALVRKLMRIGEWVGLEVAQHIDADGISMGSATLVDRTGPFATSGGVSLARPPMLTAP